MQLNRPANAPEYNKNHRNFEPQQEPVTIKAGLVLGLDKIKNQEVQTQQNFDSVALVSCLLGSFKEMNGQKEKDEEKTKTVLKDINQSMTN